VITRHRKGTIECPYSVGGALVGDFRTKLAGMGDGFQREAMSGRVAEFEDRLARLYGRVPGGAGTNRVELRRAGDADVAVTRLLCDGARSGTLEHSTHLLLVVVGDGTAIFTAEDGSEIEAKPDVPAVLGAGVRYSYTVTATRLTLLQVSSAALRARSALTGIPLPEERELPQPIDEDACRGLVALVNEVSSAIASTEINDATREAMRAKVADLILQTARDQQPSPALRGHVAAADQWIRPRLRAEITTADIADAVGISVRTLQQVFHEQLGQTPTQYVRTQRLEHVREALQKAEAGASVASIAREWGFRHIGRFSGAYNDLFGELPRITLAHGKRRTSDTAAGATYDSVKGPAVITA
jgi:AraC-like DNA-binding protein